MKNHLTTKLFVYSFLIYLFLGISNQINAQNFLHVEGNTIVDAKGDNYIIRGIGTGNWMIQEGYMMKTADVAGTQHEFRKKLEETIGKTRTEEFYNKWLENHFRKIDVDSMAAWGFNTVRVAMHYKWFTPPIEEEPVQGEITWKDKGFNMIDSLLSWCSDNQMYLILDLHGAPGGQGKDANISDYDSSKPSLWESDLNKAKTVALWRKLAERYADSPWIGGYDLINETNWTFPENNNSQLRELYGRITDTVRQVDQNHIIFIEGNSFANDFSGLTPAWDDNMVYSFHKYWNYNDANALKWMTDFREEQNRPVWLGETGENSNTWFTNIVALSEKNNIGWSCWPVKKAGLNNVLKVEVNTDYNKLIEMWKGNAGMSSDEAYQAVMTFADQHRFENCSIRRDVIDAYIRQPHSTKTLPFKKYTTGQKIFAVDYDLGRNNYAYFDVDTANYQLNTGSFTAWNTGWKYRNDGVDIEECNDSDANNGYSVGWVNKGEWLQYTINSEANASYKLVLRTASIYNALMHIEVNNQVASKTFEVPASGSWTSFKSFTVDNIILPKGEVKVKLVFDGKEINVNYFSFVEPTAISDVQFELIKTSSAKIENEIYIDLNKSVTTSDADIKISDFELKVDGNTVDISDLFLNPENIQQLVLTTNFNLFYNQDIKLSYNGNSIKFNDQLLDNFTDVSVENNFYRHFNIPSKFQAEDYIVNNGFELEDCTDTGGGKNTAYASDEDYLEYLLYVPEAGNYTMKLRVASAKSARISVQNIVNGEVVNAKDVSIESTNGWQSWETKTIDFDLVQGKSILKLLSKSGEHNLNWIWFDYPTGILDDISHSKLKVYPNPSSDFLKIEFDDFSQKEIQLINVNGVSVLSKLIPDKNISLNTSHLPEGTYLLHVVNKEMNETTKIMIVR